MKLSEMKHLLEEQRIRLTKSLGQNFLHDGNQLRRIVAAAELTSADRVLEIGPGLGPLTELLAAQAGEVLAIEKDARLARVLGERFGLGPGSGGTPALDSGTPNTGARRVLRLVHDDALEYVRRGPRDWGGWKLVANLPYAVASPLLVELAQAQPPPQRLVATLQIDVARRLMAKPGEADYGVLTLLVQASYLPRQWFRIPASCFFPKPRVNSACVCLDRREPLLLPPGQQELFIRLVKRGFSQRRKMMSNLLKDDWSARKLADAFSQAQLPPCTRAEAVTLEQFVKLAQWLEKQ